MVVMIFPLRVLGVNSIEALQPAVFMPEKLAGGISAVKVKFPLNAFGGEAVHWL